MLWTRLIQLSPCEPRRQTLSRLQSTANAVLCVNSLLKGPSCPPHLRQQAHSNPACPWQAAAKWATAIDPFASLVLVFVREMSDGQSRSGCIRHSRRPFSVKAHISSQQGNFVLCLFWFFYHYLSALHHWLLLGHVSSWELPDVDFFLMLRFLEATREAHVQRPRIGHIIVWSSLPSSVTGL